MQYVEAFNSLNYDVPNPRQDWSAESTSGICLALWRKEMMGGMPPIMDTREKASPNQDWKDAFGNKKRIKHIQRALDEFDGWVDVIIVSGDPGESYGTAAPWFPKERQNHRWRITFFDDDTGHFRAEVLKS